MFGFFKKREEVFHKLIQQQASITYEGLKLLVKYLETHDKEIAEELALKEKEADEVRRILIDELNRTFVTPFDREDIFALSRSIDDVIDYADSTVSEMVVLRREDKRLVGVVSLGDLARNEPADRAGQVLQKVSEPESTETTDTA